MSALERIRADMGRWEAVRAEVLADLPPERAPRPLTSASAAFRDALTRAVEREPGLEAVDIAERVGRKYGPVRNRLLQWGDSEAGPFHPHCRRGSGKYVSKRYFPGTCSDTCPGRPLAG